MWNKGNFSNQHCTNKELKLRAQKLLQVYITWVRKQNIPEMFFPPFQPSKKEIFK